MIGHFAFQEKALTDHIVVDMLWTEDGGAARVSAPEDVVDLLSSMEVGVREEDEVMSLSIALSYAVLLAALSKAPLHIAGDKSVWPRDWGRLIEANDDGAGEPILLRRVRRSRTDGFD